MPEPRSATAANAGTAPRPPSAIGTWLDHHLYSLLASLGRILRRPLASLLTIAVLGLALALPLGLWLVLANVSRFAGDVQASREISLFLKQDASVAQAQQLAAQLRARPDVAAVKLKTPEQGLAELRARGGLDEAIAATQANPLPSLLLVTPKADETALAAALRTLPQADLVQHDAQWRQRLDGWLNLGRRFALVLGVVLGIGALLVLGNTVRLDIQARQEELSVLQLLGATDGFIRRPFLYLGAWYGLGAGALAIGLLSAAAWALQPALAALAASYGSRFALHGLRPPMIGAVLLATVLLGWLGAGMVTGHFLRRARTARS